MVSSHTVVFLDARSSAVISVHAGFLAIALADANGFVAVIARAHPFHHEQENESNIATAYAGVPSHHPSSIPTSTSDETSSLHLQKCDRVPMRHICLRHRALLRRCSKTKGGKLQVVHLLLWNSSTYERRSTIQKSFQESAAMFSTSKESGAAAASNLQVGASGTLIQDPVISSGRPLRNDTKNRRSSRHIFTGRPINSNSNTKNLKFSSHLFSPSQQNG